MRWHAELALLPDGLAKNVTIESDEGRFTAVAPDTPPEPGDTQLAGLVLPGFANVHSHAFHRALRGRVQNEPGSFWNWRQRMYAVADRLNPDSYLALARAAYVEMALAGVTAVGEFHYIHHNTNGRPYSDPNAMGHALVTAASSAGIRLTLLDTCYLAGGLTAAGHLPLNAIQQRFSDVDAARWVDRFSSIQSADHLVVGCAVHSVRAVPRDMLSIVTEAAAGRPLHMHLSEQAEENAACLAFYGATPTEVLLEVGALGPSTTAIHGTHLTAKDIVTLGSSKTAVCACPTTERDLADGIGPAGQLANSGTPLCLGTDQHATIDLFEEAQALEMNERLATGLRGHFEIADLVRMLTITGQEQLGWPDAGRLRIGNRADLVSIRLDTGRTAGSTSEQAPMVARAADIHTVVVDGRTIVSDGHHILGDVGTLLVKAIEPLWRLV